MNNDKPATPTHISSFLAGYDKALFEAYLENHCSADIISKLTSQDRTTVYRKIRNITKRLSNTNSKLYYKHRREFNSIERKVLKLLFKDGITKKQITSQYNISRYRIYKTLQKLEQFNNHSQAN